MEKQTNILPPETANAMISKLQMLEPEGVSAVIRFVDGLIAKATQGASSWTDEELHMLSMESLQRAWEPEDSVYDDL